MDGSFDSRLQRHVANNGTPASRKASEQTEHGGQRREMTEILQLLLRRQGWLAHERLSSGSVWQLHVPAGRGARALRQVDATVVDLLRQQELVEAEDESAQRLRVSARGVWWLRRRGVALLPAAAGKETVKRPADDARHHRRQPRQQRQRHHARRKRHDERRDIERLLVRDADSGALREVAVNLKENPLMWLARRKDAAGRPYLEAHHVAAGERLRQEYEAACMQPRITTAWNPALTASDRSRLKGGPRDPYPFAERALAARQRVHAALQAVGGELADVTVAVCCLGHGIEAAERALNWPRRSARLVLRIALERLAAHYGLQPPGGSQRPRWQQALHWHAPDGHPTRLMPATEEEDRTNEQ